MPPKLRFKSPAEFFAENKNIAGFDNPGKSLYTTVRELVENGLDACESMGNLPEISVRIVETTKHEFNKRRGLDKLERVDDTLYMDHETAKQRQKREAKEKRDDARERKRLEKAGSTCEQAEQVVQGASKKRAAGSKSKRQMYFTVTVHDNGCGMAHDDIPNMLGRVLAGTKYGVRQARGKFGLGSKMALIWSKMSTGLPVDIRSAQHGKKYISNCRLDIDIHKNCPNVLAHDKQPNGRSWHGTEVCVTIEGNWTTYRSKIVQYMRLMAVITPYAMFDFVFESASKSTDLHMKFSRRIESMPPYPKEIKYHPSSIDLVTLKQLSADSRNKTLVKFLSRDLSCVTKSLAERLATELGLDADMQLSQLSDNEMMRLLQLFREAKFETPDGKCLSPAGEYNLMLGIQKQMAPEFVVTHQEKVEVFEGHPFIVEVGVCLGSGKMVKPGIQVFRFANRIPMLFEAGSDVTTRVAKKMNWGHFKISKTKDKIGVFTSIVSTKIPFKGTSKEYIGEDAKAIFNAIKHGVTVCAGSLAKKIALRRQMQEHADRKRNLEKYIGNVASAVFGVLDAELTHRAPKRARGPADADTMDSEQLQLDELYDKVKSKEVTAGTLEAHLHDHVNTVHMNAETEATGGEARELNDFYICPFGPRRFTHVVEAPAFKCAVMPVPWYTIDAGCRTVDTPMCHCPDLRYVLDLEAPTCIVQCAHRT